MFDASFRGPTEFINLSTYPPDTRKPEVRSYYQ